MGSRTAWAAPAPLIVDGFAGPGGWSEGLRLLGLRDIGLEWDASAHVLSAATGIPMPNGLGMPA